MCCNPRPDVHREAGDLAVDDLYLAGMDAGAHLNAMRLDGFDDRLGAPHRSSRSIERSEEPVTCGVHLRSPVASQQAPDSRMVPLDDLSPTMVTELRVHRGRADDVREQDRREGSIELRLLRSDRIDEAVQW